MLYWYVTKNASMHVSYFSILKLISPPLHFYVITNSNARTWRRRTNDNLLESADVETVRSGRISSKIRVSEFISNDNSSAFNKTNCVIIRDREKLTFIEIQLPGHLPERRTVNRISLICKLRKSEELQWLRTITRVSEGEFFILQLG